MSDLLHNDERRQASGTLRHIPRSWIDFGLLVLGHAVFGAYFTPIDAGFAAAGLGVKISQPILLAIWAAFARQNLYYRLLWALLLCTYLSFADDLGTVQQSAYDSWSRRAFNEKAGETIVANLAIFISTLPILLLVRRISRWQMTDPFFKEADPAEPAHRYGIHHLLLLTAIVALFCGLVRSLLILTKAGFPYPSITEFVGSLAVFLVIGSPICTVPWITLAKPKRPDSFAYMALGVAGALDIVVVPWFVPARIVIQCYWMQIGAIISAVVTTLVMRRCGFRLNQEPVIKT
jgi:hypothetical protein